MEVMKIRRAINPVFDGLKLVMNGENISEVHSVIENPFYLGIGKTFNKFKLHNKHLF